MKIVVYSGSGIEVIERFLAKHFGKRGSKIIICLVLMVFEVKNIEIHEKVGVSHRALRRYRSALQEGKISSLFIHNGYRGKSELEQYNTEILEEFDKNPPKTLRDAQERIKDLTGLTRSLHRIGVYLKKKA